MSLICPHLLLQHQRVLPVTLGMRGASVPLTLGMTLSSCSGSPWILGQSPPGAGRQLGRGCRCTVQPESLYLAGQLCVFPSFLVLRPTCAERAGRVCGLSSPAEMPLRSSGQGGGARTVTWRSWGARMESLPALALAPAPSRPGTSKFTTYFNLKFLGDSGYFPKDL